MNLNSSGGGSVSVTASASRWISLTNTVQSDVAPSLPLPSLPVFFGSSDPALRFSDDGFGLKARRDVTAQSSKIAELLRQADVSYLNLREDVLPVTCGYVDHLDLHDEVLRCDPQAFDCIIAGHVEGQTSSFTAPARTPSEPSGPVSAHAQKDYLNHLQPDYFNNKDISSASSSRKTKVKKKGSDGISSLVRPDHSELQETTIASFCELLEDICQKAELISEDRDEVEWLSLPVADLRILVNEISTVRAKKILHLVPVEILVRLLRVLDQQIHRAEGLSIEDNEHSDTHAASSVFCALESIHAALGVMAYSEMPKQLYNEEIIERILEFTRHQITDVMSAYDPTYRALHKPCDNGAPEVDEEEEFDGDFSSSGKKRRKNRSSKAKRSGVNKVSAAVHTALQKLCTILVLLKDLLLIERLSDSCILQLLKTSLTTFLVDNIHLLQLKAIGLISGIFYSYTQHRTYVIDEVIQLFWKLPISKRALKAYHLHEEQKQIQTITALIIQLVHSSANLPAALRKTSSDSPISEVSVDSSYLIKCHETVQETCCMFWTRVLQRLTSVKAQDASELKLMIENLVVDLLTTLNLPEYPAAAPLLEVLCVMLLQNAGLKSKDISARCMAIDILGTIAARLKSDVIHCHQDQFWILRKLVDETGVNSVQTNSTCTICSGGRIENSLFICQGCERLFHYDCVGMREHETPGRSWFCQFCLYKKQLLVLHSYCKSQSKIDGEKKHNLSEKNPQAADAISNYEIVQQILLSYLQDIGSSDDLHLFVRWFYLCLWSKNDPNSVENYNYYIARLKSREIVRDSGIGPSTLTRDSIKKITLALGQYNSFSRGFEKFLLMFLASLKENSPVIRAKALRAVSIIVEADPEVLRDKRVQLAVEGRFCDSAISVREAALELVGRHIASHPDVGLQYFEKVAERIKDTGVSVRKRAIKIIRDMCMSNANFPQFTSACIEIISRVSDDESSIQDLVCKTIYEFWFAEPSGSQTQYFGDGSSVPLEVAKKTDQIVETLKRLSNHQPLVTVIKRNLALDFFSQSAKASGINPLSLASVRKRCELMCKCLLEKILQVREMNCEETEVHTLPYVLVLHAFCMVDPTLCAPSTDPSMFVVTLQSYLKAQVDEKEVARLVESIIFIIDAVLPLFRKLPQNVAEELEQDLKHMIVRHSFLTVVNACIKCLCTLSKVAAKGAGVVEYLIQLFFKRLDSQGTGNKTQVGRSLFCVGLLLRYGYSLLNTSCNRKIDIGGSLRLFKKYLQVDDFGIKVRSLQALGYVLIARPDFMLEEDMKRILEATLSAGSEDRIKMQALQNIYEYLVDAESQMGTDQASNNAVCYSVEGGQSVPVAAGAGDTNICGGIVQLYWDNILDRCMDYQGHVRQSALKIVEVALRQGLIHPVTCVPQLIALETDPLEKNYKLAHNLLMSMNEKYPAIFESRLGDGLQMSFIFMQSISGSAIENQHKAHATNKARSDGTFTQARLGVSRIYKLIRGNKASRNRFMTSVVRKFDSPNWSDTIIPFLRYCAEILALLPFSVPDEPLHLIYTINRVIQVRAGALEANMRSLLHSLQKHPQPRPQENGLFQGHPLDQPTFNYMNFLDTKGIVQCEAPPQSAYIHMSSVDLNMTLQQPSYAQTISTNMMHMGNGAIQLDSSNNCPTPMNTRMSYEFSQISADLVPKIQADCLAATALQLLIKLKRHLKIVYALNDARCQAFSPNEVSKPGEVLTKQNMAFDIGETLGSLPTTYPEFAQRFQEYKNALKEDAIDYSIYTANIKRKRPTPRKGSRPGRMIGGDCEDEDDDEDWTGGRRLSNNSVRRGSSRGGRQRMFL